MAGARPDPFDTASRPGDSVRSIPRPEQQQRWTRSMRGFPSRRPGHSQRAEKAANRLLAKGVPQEIERSHAIQNLPLEIGLPQRGLGCVEPLLERPVTSKHQLSDGCARDKRETVNDSHLEPADRFGSRSISTAKSRISESDRRGRASNGCARPASPRLLSTSRLALSDDASRSRPTIVKRSSSAFSPVSMRLKAISGSRIE